VAMQTTAKYSMDYSAEKLWTNSAGGMALRSTEKEGKDLSVLKGL